jgi:alkylation response protein AidB-like acyl-CoA dehydrogenase
VRTTAVPDGDDYVINGRKQFIAHAGIARLYVVFTRTDPAKGMSEGCTSFLIPAGHPGMRFGRVHDKMGFRLLRNQEIVFENCRVPKEWMLGPLHGGLASMRAGLRSDGILNAARCLGVARRALEEIVDWCKGRIQGGKPVIEHQAIACELADMHVTLQAMRALVWNVAWSVDHEPPDPKAVPGAMIFCTENAFEIAHKAAELAGGMGVMKDMPFEKILRDAFCIKHLDGGNYLKRFKVAAAL